MIRTTDPGTARPLHVQDRQHRRTAGDTFLAWQWPLHSGEAFGWAGRLLVCAAGLPPLVLSVTGYTVWQARRRARQSRSTAT